MSAPTSNPFWSLSKCLRHPNISCTCLQSTDLLRVHTTLHSLAVWADSIPSTQYHLPLRLRLRPPILLKLPLKRSASSTPLQSHTQKRQRIQPSLTTLQYTLQNLSQINSFTNTSSIPTPLTSNPPSQLPPHLATETNDVIDTDDVVPATQTEYDQVQLTEIVPSTLPSTQTPRHTRQIPDTEDQIDTPSVVAETPQKPSFINSHPSPIPLNITMIETPEKLQVPEMPDVSDLPDDADLDIREIPEMPDVSQDHHESNTHVPTVNVPEKPIAKTCRKMRSPPVQLASDSDATPVKSLPTSPSPVVTGAVTVTPMKMMPLSGSAIKASPNSTAASTVPPEGEDVAITPFGRRVPGRVASPPSDGSQQQEAKGESEHIVQELDQGRFRTQDWNEEEKGREQDVEYGDAATPPEVGPVVYKDPGERERSLSTNELVSEQALKDITNTVKDAENLNDLNGKKELRNEGKVRSVKCRLRIRAPDNDTNHLTSGKDIVQAGSPVSLLKAYAHESLIPLSLRWPDKPMEELVICITGLPRSNLEFELAHEIVTHMGAEPVLDFVQRDVDIVVTPLSIDGSIKSRSMAVLEALAGKIPIVGVKWLVTSYTKGYWTAPDEYLSNTFKQACNDTRMFNGIIVTLDNGFTLCSTSEMAKRAGIDMTRVIRRGGGVVVSVNELQKTVISGEFQRHFHVICDQDSHCDCSIDEIDSMVTDIQTYTVTVGWLAECLMKGSISYDDV